MQTDFKDYYGLNPYLLAQKFTSKKLIDKSISLGCINAISQHIFRLNKFLFDYTTDSLGLLNIERNDTIGMEGFFPPLVKLLENKGNKLIIIEKKKEIINRFKNWLITLDPKGLESCNRILIT